MTASIRRILVAVKNVRGKASPAIRKAAQLARALDAKVELFHAITDPLAVDALAFAGQQVRKLEETTKARHLKRLEALAAPLRRNGLQVTTAAEWDYPVHEAVVRRAHHTQADLIVADQHPGRHAAPAFLRYADWELVRNSPVPLLLVKKRGQYSAPRILAAVDPSHAFAKTARLDDAVLGAADRLADALRGRLHVVHAYIPTLLDLPTEVSAPEVTAKLFGHAHKEASGRLDKALRSARLGKLATNRRHLVARHPVDAIPQVARECASEIVVLGALSRSGLKGFFIGNTAERLLDSLPCDLLVVKQPGFVTRVPTKSRGPQLISLLPPSGFV
jgi:universal stress protein E